MSGIDVATHLLASAMLTVTPNGPPRAGLDPTAAYGVMPARYAQLTAMLQPGALHGTTVRGETLRRSSLALPAAGGILDISTLSTYRRPATRSVLGLYVLDVGYTVALGDMNRIRLGGVVRATRRRPASGIDDGHWHDDDMAGMSLRWQHGERFSLSGGWATALGSGGRNAFRRILSLAAGSPIAERGFNLNAAAIVGGPGSRLRIGLGAAVLTTLPGDVAILGPGARNDLRASLSLGGRF